MAKVPSDIEEIAREVVDAAFHLHCRIGPGLLESVYEIVLQQELQRRGLKVDRQMPIDIEIDDLRIVDAFRADLIIEDRLLIELKSSPHSRRQHRRFPLWVDNGQLPR